MKKLSLLLAALVALTAQSPAPVASTPATPVATLVYEFGWNTKAAKSGQGTGTTTIEILGSAKDGGEMVSGSDWWWNTVRPRGANVCEVYPSGGITCADRPYSLSIVQLTIFSLLGKHYFSGLSGGSSASWKHQFNISAAIYAGSQSGFANTPTTWECENDLQGKGPISGGNGLVLVQLNGTMAQQGGRYWSGKLKAGIAYDTHLKLPIVVDETRTRYPQTNVYNNEYYQLKLIQHTGV
jgi:hypothetical protein